VADNAEGLATQQQSSSPRQCAADVQQALLTSAAAGASSAKQHLLSSLSVLHKAVAAAVASSVQESGQKLALEQQLEQLQAELQQAAEATEGLQGQVTHLQEQLTTAEKAAQHAKAQLQQVRLGHLHWSSDLGNAMPKRAPVSACRMTEGRLIGVWPSNRELSCCDVCSGFVNVQTRAVWSSQSAAGS
jgi:chromosome segregation ATPase